MKARQSIIAWALRAVVLIAGVELGFDAYDEFRGRYESIAEARNLDSEIPALEKRTVLLERQADEAEQQLAKQQRPPWRLASIGPSEAIAQAAATAVREELIGSGGREANVSAISAKHLSNGNLVALRLSWSEEQGAAPALFYSLTSRHPNFQLTSLRMEKRDGAVNTQLEVNAFVAQSLARR